jgi:hypothetical protein
LSVDIPTSGILDATGLRRADNAKTELTGKVNDWTIELEMQNPYCKAHAYLKAANVTGLAAATFPAHPPPPRRRKLAHTQSPGHGDPSIVQPVESPQGVLQR